MRISFVIPGQLKGKGRHRTRVVQLPGRRPFAQTYTPKETRSAEAMIRSFAAQAMSGGKLLEGPLAISVMIYKQHPQSWSTRRKSETVFVTGKSDVDNTLKLINDSCNKVIWHDDSQLSIAVIARYYFDGPEKVEIAVCPAGDFSINLSKPQPVPNAQPVPPDPLPLFRRLGRRRRAAA